MKKTIRTDYDSRNDILYIIFPNENGNSYCEPLSDGIEEMKDMDTEETTGYMIYYPYRSQLKRQEEIDKAGLSIKLSDILCS